MILYVKIKFNNPLMVSVILLQAFGQSFLQPDITVFKQNLEALENLNSKCKLYQKVCPVSSRMYTINAGFSLA